MSDSPDDRDEAERIAQAILAQRKRSLPGFRPGGCTYCEERDWLLDALMYAIDHLGVVWPTTVMSEEIIRSGRLHVEEWHRRRHGDGP